MAVYEIYTDGGASPTNPGPSGSGLAIYERGNLEPILVYGGYNKMATNNIAELKAILFAIKIWINISNKGDRLVIFSDSSYSIESITRWAYGWKKKNYFGVKNSEVIREAHDLFIKHKNFMQIKKIKGHSGVVGNELADRLVGMAIANKSVDLSIHYGNINI